MPSPSPHAPVAFEVAPGSPFFDGHFPGDPMLPGAALLQIVLQRLDATIAASWPAVALPRVRFLQPQRPGARLQLLVQDLAGGGLTVAVSASPAATPARPSDAIAPEPVANFTFARCEPLSRLAPAAEQHLPPLLGTAVVLPHAGPAVLLRQLLAGDANGLIASARVPPTSPFAAGAWASAAWIEAAAQAAAAHGALTATPPAGDAPPEAPAGMLVGLKNMHLARHARLDTDCRIEVQRVSGNGQLAIYAARVFDGNAGDGDGDLMRGDLSVWTHRGVGQG